MIVPRIVLICCEGSKTEKLYFEFIIKLYRTTATRTIEVLGKKGQDFHIIDACAAERKKYSKELAEEEADIETWAVCDNDNNINYTDLKKYAESKNIKLAFSQPCFEAYLIQHFAQSKETDKTRLQKELSRKAGQPYNKGNLDWLKALLRDKPKLIKEAIANSDRRNNRLKSPFLTVQNLTRRLIDLEPGKK
ncbi:protein RloB-like family [Candidatus Termititenax aidoneus]|uniref:Protein RloB-like family n=1 Tax=Termititenax aidoneus TaxID=2218524 RepID=A0A388TC38_TERA1|nr:protein RloB-like family [Candidatus Termititenax aidoneus]